MALLRVVPVDLLARLADLLDDQELGAALDDPLDLGHLVSGDDDEPVALGDDPLVLRRRELDLSEAHAAAAFAMKGLPPGGAVLLGAILDPLVDPPEDLLVARSPLGEVHATLRLARERRCLECGATANLSVHRSSGEAQE